MEMEKKEYKVYWRTHGSSRVEAESEEEAVDSLIDYIEDNDPFDLARNIEIDGVEECWKIYFVLCLDIKHPDTY